MKCNVNIILFILFSFNFTLAYGQDMSIPGMASQMIAQSAGMDTDLSVTEVEYLKSKGAIAQINGLTGPLQITFEPADKKATSTEGTTHAGLLSSLAQNNSPSGNAHIVLAALLSLDTAGGNLADATGIVQKLIPVVLNLNEDISTQENMWRLFNLFMGALRVYYSNHLELPGILEIASELYKDKTVLDLAKMLIDEDNSEDEGQQQQKIEEYKESIRMLGLEPDRKFFDYLGGSEKTKSILNYFLKRVAYHDNVASEKFPENLLDEFLPLESFYIGAAVSYIGEVIGDRQYLRLTMGGDLYEDFKESLLNPKSVPITFSEGKNASGTAADVMALLDLILDSEGMDDNVQEFEFFEGAKISFGIKSSLNNHFARRLGQQVFKERHGVHYAATPSGLNTDDANWDVFRLRAIEFIKAVLKARFKIDQDFLSETMKQKMSQDFDQTIVRVDTTIMNWFHRVTLLSNAERAEIKHEIMPFAVAYTNPGPSSESDKISQAELESLSGFVRYAYPDLGKFQQPLTTLPTDFSTEENARQIVGFIALFETDIKGNTVESLKAGNVIYSTASDIVRRIQDKYGSAKVSAWFEGVDLGASGTIITDAEITALTDYIRGSDVPVEEKREYATLLRELPEDYSTEENAKQIVAYVKLFETGLKGNTVTRLQTGNVYHASTRDILGRIQQKYGSGVVAAWFEEEEVDTNSAQDKLTDLELTGLRNFINASDVKEKLEGPLSDLPQDYSTEENAQKIISFIAMFETDIKGNAVENLTKGKVKNAITSEIVRRIQSRYGASKVLGWFDAKSPIDQEDAVVFGDEAPDVAYEIDFEPSYSFAEELLSKKLTYPALSKTPDGGEPEAKSDMDEMIAKRLAAIATDQAMGIEGLGNDLLPVIDELKRIDAEKIKENKEAIERGESREEYMGYDYGRMITSVIVQDEKGAAEKCVRKFIAKDNIKAMLNKPRDKYGMMMVTRVDKKSAGADPLKKHYCGAVFATKKRGAVLEEEVTY